MVYESVDALHAAKCVTILMILTIALLPPPSSLQHKSTSFSLKPMYKVSLKSHLQVTGREIAVPIEECCSVIYFTGIKEEGLLRISGNAGRSLDGCHYPSKRGHIRPSVRLSLVIFDRQRQV